MQPTKEELAKMHWRDRYDYESAVEEERLNKLTERILLERVERDDLGLYFGIWRVLDRKGTVTNAAMPMWHYLQRSPGEQNMLNRYHCAAALFQILGMADPESENDLRRQVQWDSHGEPARQEALLRLRAIIEERRQASDKDPN